MTFGFSKGYSKAPMNQEAGPAVAAVAPDGTHEKEGDFAEDEEGRRESEVVNLAERRARMEEVEKLRQGLIRLLADGVIPAAEEEI